jgi:hypothetical protein
VSLPDIDMDFCMDRRGEVINYVVDKYGKDHVAQIITFGPPAPERRSATSAGCWRFPTPKWTGGQTGAEPAQIPTMALGRNRSSELTETDPKSPNS